MPEATSPIDPATLAAIRAAAAQNQGRGLLGGQGQAAPAQQPQRDNPEDMFTPEQNLARNQQWAMPGHYNTPLAPQDEQQFRQWVQQNSVPFDPNDGTPDYDMRGFWKGQQTGNPTAKASIDPNDGRLHYPDYWKTPYAATFSNESQWAKPNAPRWNGDQYVLPSGQVIYDDKAGKWYGLPASTSDKGSPTAARPIAAFGRSGIDETLMGSSPAGHALQQTDPRIVKQPPSNAAPIAVPRMNVWTPGGSNEAGMSAVDRQRSWPNRGS